MRIIPYILLTLALMLVPALASAELYRAVLLPLAPDTLKTWGPHAFKNAENKDEDILTAASPLTTGTQGELFQLEDPGELAPIFYLEGLVSAHRGDVVIKTAAGAMTERQLQQFVGAVDRGTSEGDKPERLIILNLVENNEDVSFDADQVARRLGASTKSTGVLALISKPQYTKNRDLLEAIKRGSVVLQQVINGFPDLLPHGDGNQLVSMEEALTFAGAIKQSIRYPFELKAIAAAPSGLLAVHSGSAAAQDNLAAYQKEESQAREALANFDEKAIRDHSVTCFYCPYRLQIDDALAEIEAAIDAREAERLDAETALSFRSEDQLLSYLMTCQSCPLRETVEKELSTLKREAQTKTEETLWLKAKSANDLAQLEAYQLECKVCEYGAVAEKMRFEITAKVEDQNLFNQIQDANDRAGLWSYWLDCGLCENKKEVEEALAALDKREAEELSGIGCMAVFPSLRAHSQVHKAKSLTSMLKACQPTGATALDITILKSRANIALNRLTIAKNTLDKATSNANTASGLGPHSATLKAWLKAWKNDWNYDQASIAAVRDAAKAGDVAASLMLAELVFQDKIKGDSLAIVAQFLKRDVAAGSPRAMAALGRFYDQGLGLAKNEAEALALYRQGAEQGDLAAMAYLAQAYELGRGDYRKDQGKAVTLYMRALTGGSQAALDLLTDQKAGHSKDFWKAIQTELQTQKLYYGAIDGDYGPGTKRALEVAQSSQGVGEIPELALAFEVDPASVRQEPLVGNQGSQTAKNPGNIQYVALAFDGSKSNDFWQESRDFARRHNIKFTYFISGVYFLTKENAKKYQGPRKRRGRSDIGFGGTREDVIKRVDHVVAAAREGHEIASHANGHFNGSKWSASEWRSELRQFRDLLLNVHSNNNIPDKHGATWTNIVRSVEGMRAPLLGYGPGLWPAMQEFGYKYDTSRIRGMDFQPKRDRFGIWDFPLASLRASHGRVPSMDYNFYFKDSKGKSDPANSRKYEERMLQTYRKYFRNNYNGSRAPIHIGHHFSKWNGGAYWRAMKTFALEVCTQPNVKCVTYRELRQALGG